MGEKSPLSGTPKLMHTANSRSDYYLLFAVGLLSHANLVHQDLVSYCTLLMPECLFVENNSSDA